jgi:hypothetical protein
MKVDKLMTYIGPTTSLAANSMTMYTAATHLDAMSQQGDVLNVAAKGLLVTVAAFGAGIAFKEYRR